MVKNYHLGARSLVPNGIVESYGPLVDIPSSHVAQFEHVSMVHELNSKERADWIFNTDRSTPAQLQGGDLPRRRVLRRCGKQGVKWSCWL